MVEKKDVLDKIVVAPFDPQVVVVNVIELTSESSLAALRAEAMPPSLHPRLSEVILYLPLLHLLLSRAPFASCDPPASLKLSSRS